MAVDPPVVHVMTLLAGLQVLDQVEVHASNRRAAPHQMWACQGAGPALENGMGRVWVALGARQREQVALSWAAAPAPSKSRHAAAGEGVGLLRR